MIIYKVRCLAYRCENLGSLLIWFFQLIDARIMDMYIYIYIYILFFSQQKSNTAFGPKDCCQVAPFLPTLHENFFDCWSGRVISRTAPQTSGNQLTTINMGTAVWTKSVYEQRRKYQQYIAMKIVWMFVFPRATKAQVCHKRQKLLNSIFMQSILEIPKPINLEKINFVSWNIRLLNLGRWTISWSEWRIWPDVGRREWRL